MARAEAKHILVEDEQICIDLKQKILDNELTFEEAAESYSQCPSGNEGGNLGQFGEGEMVAEFDKVVFNDEIGVVHGPVKTQFGFHLLFITSREA
jgi:peptidyl-prolyl cis-trans isomerase C